MANTKPEDDLAIDGVRLRSRMWLGSTESCSLRAVAAVLDAVPEVEVATVAIRRAEGRPMTSILDVAMARGMRLLPNTSGCSTARQAVLTAKLGREITGTNWVKLELTQDGDYQFPDPRELLIAAERLVAAGFVVSPYMSDDPGLARRLAEVGCAAVMPHGSPIGSGRGIGNPFNISVTVEQSPVPVILDAGIGAPSDAALAMELGCSAVALASAVFNAADPERMARAMFFAVDAGRQGHLAGRMPVHDRSIPSSPISGLIEPTDRAGIQDEYRRIGEQRFAS